MDEALAELLELLELLAALAEGLVAEAGLVGALGPALEFPQAAVSRASEVAMPTANRRRGPRGRITFDWTLLMGFPSLVVPAEGPRGWTSCPQRLLRGGVDEHED